MNKNTRNIILLVALLITSAIPLFSQIPRPDSVRVNSIPVRYTRTASSGTDYLENAKTPAVFTIKSGLLIHPASRVVYLPTTPLDAEIPEPKRNEIILCLTEPNPGLDTETFLTIGARQHKLVPTGFVIVLPPSDIQFTVHPSQALTTLGLELSYGDFPLPVTMDIDSLDHYRAQPKRELKVWISNPTSSIKTIRNTFRIAYITASNGYDVKLFISTGFLSDPGNKLF